MRVKEEKVSSDSIVFFLNGKKIVADSVDPEWTLIFYLREKLHLPGTKLGCAEGGCGACTVMVSKIDQQTDRITHYTVNSCLTLIGSVHGMAVTTVEGIGSTKTRLHPVQERLAKSHGSQCGFCTPGFVMSMYTLLRNNPQPTMQEIEDNLVGNLCRCTGYRPIVEGFRTFSKESQSESQAVRGCGKQNCCQLQKVQENGFMSSLENGLENGLCEENECHATAVLFDPSTFAPYDPTQEVIFPPELKIRKKEFCRSITLRGQRVTYYRPTTLSELLNLKNQHKGSKVVIGNTEIGVEVKYKNQEYPVIISPLNVFELLGINITESFVEVGAAVTLSDIETSFKKLVTELKDSKTRNIRSFLRMLKVFSSKQIRNVACLGGNIMTSSPISDLNPLLLAAGAVLKFQNINEERVIKMDENFFTSYRKTVAQDNDVLISVRIPFTAEDEYVEVYKQSRRRQDDIAIVNSAMKVKLKPESLIIDSLTLVFGGMGPTTVFANETMKKFKGCKWNDSLVENMTTSLLKELQLDPSAPGGMTDYREALCASFFLKFYLKVSQELEMENPGFISQADQTPSESLYYPTKSMQFFQNVPKEQALIDPVGRPIPHAEALQQTTGEATYTDDIPNFTNELHAVLVTSTRCYAKIIDIDPSEALNMEGVEGFFCAKDLSELNNRIYDDEELFASETVLYYGQIVGIIIAHDRSTAWRAIKKVLVTYEDLPNPVITIEEAIKSKALFGYSESEAGDVERGFVKADHVLEGEILVGGQEHFYLETNVAIAVPHENGEMEVITSTQNLTETQMIIANVLNLPANRVRCRVKKIGGGFGGKETRSNLVSVPVAFAASRLGRPVRLMLDRHEDMTITGGRHPFLGKWKAGFNSDGTLVALEQALYSNAGSSRDKSPEVTLRAVLGATSAYRVDNLRVTGHCCKTNLASNTSFRAFGAPQGILVTEEMLSRIAHYLKMDLKQVQEKNLCRPFGDCTPFRQELSDCKVRHCWDEAISRSDYSNRRKMIEEFNRNNAVRKRGIATVPLLYGIGLNYLAASQGAALLHVYTDGSILISSGGVEMGQGLHTKMLQVASRTLKVPIEKFYICDTSTDKVPNTTSTCASISSDLYGAAILDACEKLLRRINPYKKQNPDGQWEDWIRAAYLDRVSLSVTGFYKITDIGEYDFSKKILAESTKPYNYFCYGAGVSEVEIDCLTGDHRVLRTDIVMDVGNSLNPAIDIGQIEGAFAQGIGLVTTEELIYSPEGVLMTKGPGAYKIPSIQDIPREINVSLLRGSENPRAVYSSKAVGEPPLCLAVSVFLAIKDAIKAARGGDDAEVFRLDSPATVERIRMGCEDSITKMVKQEYQLRLLTSV